MLIADITPNMQIVSASLSSPTDVTELQYLQHEIETPFNEFASIKTDNPVLYNHMHKTLLTLLTNNQPCKSLLSEV